LRSFFWRRQEFKRLETRLKEGQSRLAEKQYALAKAQRDNDFLELAARRNLGLVRPDEVEFRFVSHPPEDPAPEEMHRRAPSKKDR
jgi:cell division protein FtsB